MSWTFALGCEGRGSGNLLIERHALEVERELCMSERLVRRVVKRGEVRVSQRLLDCYSFACPRVEGGGWRVEGAVTVMRLPARGCERQDARGAPRVRRER